MAKIYDRVKFNVSGAPNQGTATVGSRSSSNFYLPAEVSSQNQTVFYLLLNSSSDEEHGVGVVASDGLSVTRARVISSIIGGVAGTTKINAGSNSVMGFTSAAEAFRSLRGSRSVTGATDTMLESDGSSAIIYTRATAIAVTIPQPGAGSGFNEGWFVWVKNTGVGDVTFTPTSSTISGSATLTIKTGQGSFIWSDGTNFHHFSLIGAIGELIVKSSSASAFAVGQNGASNSALLVDAFTTSAVTGFKITAKASGSGVALEAISSASNESVTINAKGTGTITIQGTATGSITLARNTSVSGVLAVSDATASTGYTNGAVTIAGGLGVTGSINSNSYINAAPSNGYLLGGITAMVQSGSYTSFYSNTADERLLLGNNTDAAIYYRAPNHYFQDNAGTTWGRFSTGGFILIPSNSVTPLSNGHLMFQATSNSSLTFKYKGTDGTIRSGSIALA